MMNATDPQAELDTCAEAIRASGIFERAGMVESWPMATEYVARLLFDGGCYEVSAADLRDLIARGIVPNPAIEGDTFEWYATDVVLAVSALEFRRQWRPFAPIHAHKKTSLERLIEEAQTAGKVGDIVENPVGVPRFDLTHILEIMAQSHNPDERRGLVSLAKLTLQHDHGVTIR